MAPVQALKPVFRKSFYDILNAIRIQKAQELLLDPKLKIGEISEMVGYADTAHFARTFKKITGMSANEYRNSFVNWVHPTLVPAPDPFSSHFTLEVL